MVETFIADPNQDTSAPLLEPLEIEGRRGHVEFWRVLDLMAKLRAQTSQGRQDITQRCQFCDLFVLDDLGAERANDFAMEELERIIEWRHADRRAVAVATKFTGQGIVARYGDRIISRWAQQCRSVQIGREVLEPSYASR
jgi:DNA replication protein DnaC